MAKSHKFSIKSFIIVNEEEISVTVNGDVYPGTPDVHYPSNGDPGYPGDPPECNVDSIVDANKKEYFFDDLDDSDKERIEGEAWEASKDFYEPDYDPCEPDYDCGDE